MQGDRKFYETRLTHKTSKQPITLQDNIEKASHKLKTNILTASAKEAIRERMINFNAKKNTTSWLANEVKLLSTLLKITKQKKNTNNNYNKE